MFNTLLFILAVSAAVKSHNHVNFYRKDYSFIEEFDAFYKIHWKTSGLSWTVAMDTCDDEGAKLFYPKMEKEWTVVNTLLKSLAVVPNVTDTLIGIHDVFGLGKFYTIDGHFTPSLMATDRNMTDIHRQCMLMDIETGTYKVDACEFEANVTKSFVCKRVDEYPPPCPTIDEGYVYNSAAKKCYKKSKKLMVWEDAIKTCDLEGASLAVPGNDNEATAILITIAEGSALIGIRKKLPERDYYTLTGQKLKDIAFHRFRNDKHSNENCVVGELPPSKHSSYNNMFANMFGYKSCDIPMYFVCEMKARHQK